MTGTLEGDEELHLAALRDLINDALPASVRAYDSDSLPPEKPEQYVELFMIRRPGARLRASGETSTAGWRLGTRVVSAASISDARNTAKKVRGAVEFARITVGGKTSTPIQFESAEVIGPDSGSWSGLTAWTYAL